VPVLRLRAVAGARRGQEFSFSGPRIRIGRSRDNDLILPERDSPASSGHHAEALLDSTGTWSVVDLGSSNGTRVNNLAVERHTLKPGDRLTFGNEQFVVSIGRTPRRQVWILPVAGMALLVAAGVLVERHRTRTPFEDMATSATPSVFLIAVEDGGKRTMVGTAFVVAADGVLATNAHVADALQKRAGHSPTGGAPQLSAVQSDSYVVRAVSSMAIHPDWRQGSLRADVALLRLAAGPPLTPLRLADATTIASLRRGTPVAALGFPAVSTDPVKPRGRLAVDVVGDVRDDFLEVGLGVTPGTSGSPIFDESGSVVAMVVGGDFVDGPGGATLASGSAANWAISVRVVRDLLARQP
jgi:S1-C subfamily serine protease